MRVPRERSWLWRASSYGRRSFTTTLVRCIQPTLGSSANVKAPPGFQKFCAMSERVGGEPLTNRLGDLVLTLQPGAFSNPCSRRQGCSATTRVESCHTTLKHVEIFCNAQCRRWDTRPVERTAAYPPEIIPAPHHALLSLRRSPHRHERKRSLYASASSGGERADTPCHDRARAI